ncbi:type IV pilus modification protein PilV [Ramlibacter algicola]|uniref:Type IV pilus modification protein PilV n=1 Tax=Ramlibacter algicola TaxID=2795217 RepID=A0A934PYR8_9BURK|nr:type IV pilus modification protein PilV [Ramlibacter algicola]MBK0392944.1 type IV pilus modification protein PilV [Ramlibacter algicola]
MTRRRMRMSRPRRRQAGATLVEILVSLMILMVGLLGLIGVMVQSQRAQLESYQRVQALLLAQDMVARIASNRMASDCYALGTTEIAAGSSVPAPPGTCATAAAAKTRATQDLTDWQNLLAGAAEQSGGNNAGSILGARGCISKDATTGIFQVSVAWQGINAVGAPPAGITCGTGQFGADDAQRRAVSVTVLPPTAS